MSLQDFFRDGERAVSPVIGVILMVAITVILAAVIGTFVLNLGGSVQANPQAGVSFSQSTGSVTITVTSAPRADTIEYTTVDNSGDGTDEGTGSYTAIGSIGDSVVVGDGGSNDLESSDRIIVRATYDGNTAVISEYTYN